MLDHKASYLCFLPRITNTALGKNIYLTKVVVKSNNAIAGNYTLSFSGLSSVPTSGAASEVTLTTSGTEYTNGFPLTNTVTSVPTNAAYMVIAPGTHSLTVDFYIKDPATNVEAAITKSLPMNKLFEANKVYDITANLTPTDYSDRQYYMWDAQQSYWYQHEWNSSEPWQPVLNGPAYTNNNYAIDNTDSRWYNEDRFPTAASHTAAHSPNVNELYWYAIHGDPRWDDTPWSTMGHLYRGGMWFKKLSVIATANGKTLEELKATAPDGTDYTTLASAVGQKDYPTTQGKPISTTDYFYLPALGHYNKGQMMHVGVNGDYWSSTSSPVDYDSAYPFVFNSRLVRIYYRYARFNGFTLWPSEL